MGVLNITPDSFSDGGELWRNDAPDLAAVERRACDMLAQGAAILDVGGESTRPGAQSVSIDAELARVIPVVERLCQLDSIVSVDTRHGAVAREAVRAGAHMINDVSGVTDLAMLDVIAESDAAVCIMHMRGEPATMQKNIRYRDVVAEVRAFLDERVATAVNAGVAKRRIVVDPGFGFGKELEHNLRLLASLNDVRVHGLPILAGLSRKRMIGALTGRAVAERAAGSVAAALRAIVSGAQLVRVHDVAETVDALKVWTAVDAAGETNGGNEPQ